jgi:hypothetical protein
MFQDPVLRTPVWHEMAKNSAARDPQLTRPYQVEAATVPPNSMKAIKVRFRRQVGQDELFAVHLVQTSLRTQDHGNVRAQLAKAVGWDPEDGLVCQGPPTVMIYNMSSQPLRVQAGDVMVNVCAMRAVTHYYTQKEATRLEAQMAATEDHGPVAVANHVSINVPVHKRPKEYPEFLWQLISPEDQCGAAAMLAQYRTEGDIVRYVDEAIYNLNITPDNRAVEQMPWSCTVMEPASVDVKTEVEGQEVGLATRPESQSQQAHHQADKRVWEFFKDPARIQKERERSQAQKEKGRLITATDLDGEPTSTRLSGEGERNIALEMEAHEAEHLSEEHRAMRMQNRMAAVEETRKQLAQAEEDRKEKARREKRDADMWVDGIVGGKPTQMAFLIAQVLAHLTAYFHPDPDNPPTVKGFVAEIETTDEIPVQARARKLADIQKAYLKAMTKRLIKQGKLEESTGEYSSGLVLVPYHDRIKIFMDKWGDAAQAEMWKPEHEAEVGAFYRCTCDYRALNNKSKSDVFPLPRIDDLLDQIPRGTCHFSMGDVQDAFWTVKLAEWCREKTAIRTHDQHLQWTVLPQGWKGAANYWARVVAKVFENISQDQALVYQDDVMVHSTQFGEHYQTLGKIYKCLQARQLTFKLKKTYLNMPSATFLGHMVDASGRYPCVEKVKAIMEKDYPSTDVTAVRSFIGMTLYYRNYIYDYANKVAPLHALTRKGVNVPDSWTEEHTRAVDVLKEDLCSHPCLMNIDNTKPYQLRVDACRRGHGLGGVLLQQDDNGDWRPVSWWSRALTKEEKEYSSTELECKAMHDMILYYDVYLQGVQFDVFTDHAALIYMVKAQTASNNGRLMRYLMDIQHYNFRLHYKKGTLHLDADAVSRLLKFGETPEYLSADDLETDKGPVTEEEMLVAKDLADKKRRRIQRAEERKAERREMQAGTQEVYGSRICWEGGNSFGFVPYAEDDQIIRRELRASALKRQKPPPKSRYHMRVRQSRTEGPKVRSSPGVESFDGMNSPGVVKVLEQKRKCGYNRLKVVESTIQGAGYGLFLSIPKLKAGGMITSYEGVRLSKAQVLVSNSDYIYETYKGGRTLYIDAEAEDSCYGRFINDPRDDTLVNAKVILKGDRLVVIATTDIHEGDEIFIDYGVEYWADKVDKLPPHLAAEVRHELAKRGIKTEREGRIKSHTVTLDEMVVQAPGARGAIVRSRLEQLSDIEREKYVIDNVEQSEQLADDLQYLVGRQYFDDETGHQYEVESVLYDEDHKAVIAYRRAMDGRYHKLDDAPFLVYGEGGILQLCELWGIDDGRDRVVWPADEVAWAQAQAGDEEVLEKLSKCVVTNQEYEVGHDVLVAYGDQRILHRRSETSGRVLWQVWVPQQLRHLCMTIHHEGSAHPGSWRMLHTTKLRFFWPAMRNEISQHCAECRGCALRSKYFRQPRIPVQEYPAVCQPLGRIHIDLTGELPITDGNGSRYIMVVKDFHTKFVWLFAIKAKDAVAIADQLVTELYCRWGIPEMLVSDRGAEFRNKLVRRINHIFRVNRIATTPYNPRSNGFVENHNGTLKDQLYHYVEARQKDWDIFLPTVQLMYNTTVNAATAYTPYYLMFGRECNMPAMGGMMNRAGDAITAEEGMEAVGQRERTVQEQWEEALVEALATAWEEATVRAHDNAARGNRAGRAQGIQFKEYSVGDMFYRKRNRVRSFKSVQEKETYKINLKLQARYEGPYRIVDKVNAVVYVAEIDGVRKRIHAVNMKPMAKSPSPRGPRPADITQLRHYIDELNVG